MDVDPFPDVAISPSDFLDAISGRRACPKCNKSRKFYCYTCYVPVDDVADKIPQVMLPLAVDIIKHKNEVDGKSTAAHAAVLAPRDVTIYTYPVIPDYHDRHKILLVFPGDNAVTLEELAQTRGVQLPDDRATNKRRMDRYEEESDGKRSRMAATDAPDTESGQKSVPATSDAADTEVEQFSVPASSSDADKEGGHPFVPTSSNATKFDAEQPFIPAPPDTAEVEAEQTCAPVSPNDGADVKAEQPSVRAPDDATQPELAFTRVVFIDSTWNQCKKIFLDERLRGLVQVELKQQTTRFWRHQVDKPRSYLATVEAIYYFCREFRQHFLTTTYSGQYDNLLFFFRYMYHKIRADWEAGKVLRAYQQ